MISLLFMRLEKLSNHPVAASMIGRGDSLFYSKEGKEDFPVVVSETTTLKFNEKPKYKVMFTEDNAEYVTGDGITTNRENLSLEKEKINELEETFMLYL